MPGLNKVMIIGNLGRDPEMRYTQGGVPVTNFSVAVTRSWNGPDGDKREETEWFNIVTWRNLAESCSQYLNKGSRVYVEGRLQTRSWESEDGKKNFRTEVQAFEVQFLTPRNVEGANGAPPGDGDIDPDDIPF